MSGKLTDAICLAAEAHDGQTDRAGQPYILHPLRVMLAMDDDVARIAAVLHDVVEDSETVGLWDILALFGEDVRSAVDSVTRRSGETYEDFIARAAKNPVGRRIKLADIADNTAPSRSASLPDHLRRRYTAGRAALEAEADR